MLAVALDGGCRINRLDGGLGLAEFFDEDVGEAQNRGQWRADFVRDFGHTHYSTGGYGSR